MDEFTRAGNIVFAANPDWTLTRTPLHLDGPHKRESVAVYALWDEAGELLGQSFGLSDVVHLVADIFPAS